jgi:isopenicillin N synthase-like dioxygenase
MATSTGVYQRLKSVLSEKASVIARGVAPEYAEQLANLLRRAPPPVLRITHYPGQSSLAIVNHPHKDIDLLTLLPRATAPSLQIMSNYGWREVQTNEDAVIVLGGEMLQLLGGPVAEVHRVMATEERLSVSFFVNASPDERLPDGELARAVLEGRLRIVRGSREQI